MHRSKNTAGKKGNQNNSPPCVVDETHSGNGVMVVHCKPSLDCGFTVTGYMENQQVQLREDTELLSQVSHVGAQPVIQHFLALRRDTGTLFPP